VPVGAVAFGTLSWALGPVPALPAFLVVAGFGVLLAAIDLACLRLPDPLVAAAALAAVAGLLTASLAGGEFGPFVRAGSAAMAMFIGYLVLAPIPGAIPGLGDVKLAGLLGLMLGWIGWPAVLFGALLPHLINGPLALFLLLSGKARRDAPLPLGPALLAGAWLAIVGLAAWWN
jgi:leader peptidase (prepilin peptidase)/N-methyltransferase